jgi:hypothetical protein
MIRSFLLDHEIEAHVLHENAGNLWCGAVADCVLAVHGTDAEFLNEAFSAPREKVTDESEFPASEFHEQESPPLHFGWNFFLSVGLVNVALAWSVLLLLIVLSVLLRLMGAGSSMPQTYAEPLISISLDDVLALTALTGLTFVLGLLFALATVVGRLFRPSDNGDFSLPVRWAVFLVFWLFPDSWTPILWYLFTFRS